MREVEKNARKGIEIICEDQGPGITNIDLVMQDGYTTSRGMGMGLPGAKRLMDEFDIKSSEGVGTTIKQRDELHRMAEANKAFAHYRW